MAVMIYIILIISYLLNKLIIPLFGRLYINAGFIKENYKGELIPNAMGIIYVLNVLIIALLLVMFTASNNYVEIFVFILGILTMGFIGLLDDFIGDNFVKGFKGHIKMLLSLKLTTGGLKAVLGGIVSILISSLISIDFINFLINTLIISLFTNFINLMDLRPGRAIKVFMIFSLPSLFYVSRIYKIILVCFIGASLAYFPYDIKGRSMLGDIGSNCLGIILGIIATSYTMYIKILLVVFLGLANLYSEKHSITKFIGKNKLLNFLDELGRG
jgi:UDP-N-acetylmuramyl pentapeptide phosphotransferase/UDP-N-acetylglucosamine-1-phosphate transferase